MLMLHGSVLVLRIAHHVVFPLFLFLWNRRTPMPVLPDLVRIGGETGSDDVAESLENKLSRIRGIVDANFHKVQVSRCHVIMTVVVAIANRAISLSLSLSPPPLSLSRSLSPLPPPCKGGVERSSEAARAA